MECILVLRKYKGEQEMSVYSNWQKGNRPGRQWIIQLGLHSELLSCKKEIKRMKVLNTKDKICNKTYLTAFH